MADDDCVAFLEWALPRLGFRWPGFRRVRRQVCKRIGRRMAGLGLADVAAYRRYLEAQPSEWAVLDECCRITVSRFCRDRGVFDFLAATVLPALAAEAASTGAAAVRAWSAGCASGEEPYGLSIAWRLAVAARAPGLALRVVATDADPHMIARARRGCYAAGSLRELPDGWRDAAFEAHGRGFRLRPAFRRGIDFRCQDLRRERPEGRFDLVACRNLAFTYFDARLQARVLARIEAALRPGGALVLGRRERLPTDASGFDEWNPACRVYRRAKKNGPPGDGGPSAGRHGGHNWENQHASLWLTKMVNE